MNKPNFKEFDDRYFDLEVAEHLYLQELDKYCDELEKALDKACKILFDNCAVIEDEKEGYHFAKDCEEWKEWCMKGDLNGN